MSARIVIIRYVRDKHLPNVRQTANTPIFINNLPINFNGGIDHT